MNQPRLYANRTGRSRGFSTLELLLVMVVSLIIAALAIPKFDQVRRTLRISGDARELNGAINQAKLQAAADFTDARVFIDLTGTSPANPLAQFHVDVWNKNGLGPGVGCWQVVGDYNNPCYTPGVSPVQNLSPNVCFPTAPGCPGLPGAPPPNTQTTIGQGLSAAGSRCTPVNGRRVGQVSTTACVQLNSRGVPIDSTGTPTGGDALYISDGTQVYAITVGSTGMSQVWASSVNGPGAGTWYHK